MSERYEGSCFCGEVTFTLQGDPQVMGFCHCTDCAGWAGAPVNAFSLWSPEDVTITGGEDKISTFKKTEASHRKYCIDCGGHIMTDHPGMGMIDVYLNCVPAKKHEGTLHIFYGEKTMSVPDGLPKYKDMPSEFGGSGDTLPE